ncbi:hypothetical protein ACJJTC_003365 [Scirpophaga incertulas]
MEESRNDAANLDGGGGVVSGNMAMSNNIIKKLQGVNNYATWMFQMKLLLIDFGLWNCIEGDEEIRIPPHLPVLDSPNQSLSDSSSVYEVGAPISLSNTYTLSRRNDIAYQNLFRKLQTMMETTSEKVLRKSSDVSYNEQSEGDGDFSPTDGSDYISDSGDKSQYARKKRTPRAHIVVPETPDTSFEEVSNS